jgi:hypothetical protein
MPAGPVGSVWASGSWSDTVWEVGTWANAVIATDFGDLTTLFVGYVDDLKDANPLKVDSTTLVVKDYPNVIAGTADLDDINTRYAEHLS